MEQYDRLPDAPWIVESWYTGDDPDHAFDPWNDIGGDWDTRPGGAADTYCHQILGTVMGLDQGTIDEHEADLLDVWCGLKDEVQEWYCEWFRKNHPEETRLLYNKWYFATQMGGGDDDL